MNNEEINRRVAEILGVTPRRKWKVMLKNEPTTGMVGFLTESDAIYNKQKQEKEQERFPEVFRFEYSDPEEYDDWSEIPNYCGCLNAMAGAVEKLTEEDKNAYAVILAGMLWTPSHTRGWQDWRDTLAVSEATALQRATAFVRVHDGKEKQ